jgi:hypothetical protein
MPAVLPFSISIPRNPLQAESLIDGETLFERYERYLILVETSRIIAAVPSLFTSVD